MEVSLSLQPFNSQGVLTRLGADLIAEMSSGHYTDVHILSAFVTSSGTQRLSHALQSITGANGRVFALIGVNNGLTSIQAVADLHAVGVEVFGFHTGGSILYHPKVYLMRGATRAWISVGSSNLTGDGMFRNIEANTVVRLDLTLEPDLRLANEALAWFQRFRGAHRNNALHLLPAGMPGFLQAGVLSDEIEKAREARSAPSREASRRPSRNAVAPRFSVPALPSVASQRPVSQRQRGRTVQTSSIPAPSMQTRFFAMLLSAHDASKKTGTPGTPELSLPRPAIRFFPPMSQTARQYPDAYFDVRLNEGNRASTVEYRIWERHGGRSAGHADLRLNIKHETVDLTTNGGGDIILFEASPTENGPAYEVWIVNTANINYESLLARCTQEVAARGAADPKRYGFF